MKILFLCSSNIFRSQMAEAFFNKISKQNKLNHKAKSAALIRPQDKMHALVVRAMKEAGIDISHQKSKKVTQKMINEADLIVLMNLELKELLNTKISKTIEIWNIPDVVAKETDKHLYIKFVKIRDITEEKVKELMKTLN